MPCFLPCLLSCSLRLNGNLKSYQMHSIGKLRRYLLPCDQGICRPFSLYFLLGIISSLQFCLMMLILSCLPLFHNTENYQQLVGLKIFLLCRGGTCVCLRHVLRRLPYKTGAGAYGLYFLQSGVLWVYRVSWFTTYVHMLVSKNPLS